GAFGSIRFLKNITGLWIIQECRRYWEAQGKTIDYGEITAEAMKCEGFRSIINPNNQIFVQAGNMIPKIQNYCKETGQPVPETIGEIIRCGNDSLALAYRQVVENLEELSGKTISQIHMVGGGTKNVLLSKLTADITGKTVVTGPIEGTVIGNLLMQGLGEGVIKDIKEAREIVRNSEDIKVIEPNSDFNCDKVYAKFKTLP
ncbi:MAG: rhamnulokinase, partial [Armatimonadetes bacterium]|nr:rhamnulokinase [Candidatus Hippobium faecium]